MRRPDQTGTCAYEAATLLPWYVNGTLTAEERRSIEDHLVACPVCPKDLLMLLKVQAGLRRELAGAPEPSAALWERVRNQVGESTASQARTVPSGARAQDRTAWAWIGDLLGPVLRPGWALAALLCMAVQAALIVGLLVKGPVKAGPEYGTLTGPPTSGQPLGPRVRLRVAFVEQAPERAIRIVLEEVQATIVDGPSAAGFYLIDVPLLNGAERSRDQVLRGRSEVIRFAEVAGR